MNDSISSASNASRAIYLSYMSEPPPTSYEGVYLGKSMIYKNPVFLDASVLANPHIAAIGTSGSGKTYLIKSIIAKRVMHENYSVFVIDWNGEYTDLIHLLDGKVIALGRGATINLYQMLWQSDKRSMGNATEIVRSAAKLDKPEEDEYTRTVVALRQEMGVERLTLRHIIRHIDSHNGPLNQNLSTKLRPLLDNPIFSESTSFDPASVLSGVISIDLSSLKSDTQRDFVSQSLLHLIANLMHSMRLDPTSRRMLVVDEAWRMFPNRADIGALFREGRKYGLGVVVASQMVGDINNEVLANCATIFVFRLHSGSDCALLAEMGAVTEEERQKLSGLNVGSCLVIMGHSNQSIQQPRFFIEKVDGVDLKIVSIRGVKMGIELSSRRFFKVTEEQFGVGATLTKLHILAEENEGKLDAWSIITTLIGLGFNRADIVPYLKELGLPDIEIIWAFEASKNLHIAKGGEYG
ncbi:MAG TPA: ATP-binding protein [Candidatus Acidoferrales bacterium]|nr:ATP-binding protein [Candidatus Acidoferrales bacterium]